VVLNHVLRSAFAHPAWQLNLGYSNLWFVRPEIGLWVIGVLIGNETTVGRRIERFECDFGAGGRVF
jgi:hypothetical protein